MLGLFRKKNNSNTADVSTPVKEEVSAESPPKKQGFFHRLKAKLSKTRAQFTQKLLGAFKGKNSIDPEVLEELESILIQADLGLETTEQLLNKLEKNKAVQNDPQKAISFLKDQLTEMLQAAELPLDTSKASGPFLLLMVGVNGAGKTTSIGKITKSLQEQGKSVLLAAGDTFRAAAIEQLEQWGEREDVTVIAQHQGADSASVIFDAYQAATSRNIDVIIADTAGRLHTQGNLMNELEKITRVVKKLDETAPHEILLVLDASFGQNAIRQVEEFKKAVGVTGLCITKLDGTAKAGAIFAIANKFKLPIRFLGVGEDIDDLKPFKAKEFTDALFVEEEVNEET